MENIVSVFDSSMDLLKSHIKTALESINSFLSIFSNFSIGAIVITTIFIIAVCLSLLRPGFRLNDKSKRTKLLSVCAMFISINVILGYFSLNLTSYLRIGFSFITTPVSAYMFGPIIGGFVALLSDIVSYILKPTGGFLFTYTLCTGISGMLYGILLFNKKPTLARIFFSNLFTTVFINILLNSIALAPTAGNGLIGIVPARIIKNILLIPIQTVTVYIILNVIVRKIKQMRFQ